MNLQVAPNLAVICSLLTRVVLRRGERTRTLIYDILPDRGSREELKHVSCTATSDTRVNGMFATSCELTSLIVTTGAQLK